MSFLDLFLIALGLSMDAFAVSICKGLSVQRMQPRHALACGVWFGAFQALMPLLGYLLGAGFAGLIGRFSHWVAFALLAFIGVNMLRESFGGEEEAPDPDFSPKAMLPLALATSIDALAAGVSFAAMQVQILPAVGLIGVTTCVFSAIGVKVGNLFGVRFKALAERAGGAVLVHETLDQVKEPRQAWGYNAGQRRVRRAPNLAYDTPIAAADGLRTADDTDMFNGAPDRYDWKLLGKKEIYIPYNNYKVSSPEVKYEELLKPGHLDPQYTRYELHRVWVVEGTLKPGARHIYSKRTLYLDEDSWSAAVVDQYDGRGELWRVSMAYLKNFYDLPYTWSALDVFHDLQARRYHVQNLDNEEPGTIDFTQAIPDDSYFKPSALRRRGTR